MGDVGSVALLGVLVVPFAVENKAGISSGDKVN